MDLKIVAVLFSLIFRSTFAYAGGLSLNFYEQSCPQVEYIVRTSLRSISLTDPTTPAAILRLLFHDCQVQVFFHRNRFFFTFSSVYYCSR